MTKRHESTISIRKLLTEKKCYVIKCHTMCFNNNLKLIINHYNLLLYSIILLKKY